MTKRKAGAPDRRARASYLQLSDFERLEEWCANVRILFAGEVPYLVGSAMTRDDYRDVDLRVVLDDEVFDSAGYRDAPRLRMLNRAVSAWGQRDTGLPIDFQVQRRTEARAFDGPVNPMGMRDWQFVRPAGTPLERRRSG